LVSKNNNKRYSDFAKNIPNIRIRYNSYWNNFMVSNLTCLLKIAKNGNKLRVKEILETTNELLCCYRQTNEAIYCQYFKFLNLRQFKQQKARCKLLILYFLSN